MSAFIEVTFAYPHKNTGECELCLINVEHIVMVTPNLEIKNATEENHVNGALITLSGGVGEVVKCLESYDIVKGRMKRTGATLFWD